MKYYLAKTDPETYSIDNFAKEKKTTWSGVRNPQAVNALKAMKPGDKVFIYHSQGQTTIRGLAKVIGNSRPDPKDNKSWLVDFALEKIYKEPFVSLKDIKESNQFNDFVLLKQSRLSTMEVPLKIVNWILKRTKK